VNFTPEHNEKLKGVSRRASLEIVLGLQSRHFTEAQKDEMAERKNAWYTQQIALLTPEDALPGVVEFLNAARALGLPLAVGSASKNTPLILERTGLRDFFDTVVDGNSTSVAKPDPEVFLLAAKGLGLAPGSCLVFEDAAAGVEAARRAAIRVVGLGQPSTLFAADVVLRGFLGVTPSAVLAQFSQIPSLRNPS
jgi:beta-phosphoglucomutase